MWSSLLEVVVSPFSMDKLFNLQWWLEYVVTLIERDPGHIAIELLCGALIIYLLLKKSYDPSKAEKKLTKEVGAFFFGSLSLSGL